MNSQDMKILESQTAIAKILYTDANIEFYQWCGNIWIRGELVATYEGIIE